MAGSSLGPGVLGDIRVVEAIREHARQRATGQPGPRVALAIQGGGLRAIISCAAADALDVLGLRHAFDVVYGGSSGAVNAAYFLAGQAALGVTVYAEDVNNLRFFNPLRFGRALDLEYFINEIVRDRKPLDLKALASRTSLLKIALTDCETGEIVWYDDIENSEVLFQAFEATCAIPGAYPQPVLVGGRAFTDGMINEPIPVLTAVKENYRALLVLLTRPANYRERGTLLRRTLIRGLMRRHASSAVFERLLRQWQSVNEGMEALAAPGILALTCDPDLVPNRFEMRRERLLAAAYSGWRTVLEVFEYPGDRSRRAFDQRLKSAKMTIPEKSE